MICWEYFQVLSATFICSRLFWHLIWYVKEFEYVYLFFKKKKKICLFFSFSWSVTLPTLWYMKFQSPLFCWRWSVNKAQCRLIKKVKPKSFIRLNNVCLTCNEYQLKLKAETRRESFYGTVHINSFIGISMGDKSPAPLCWFKSGMQPELRHMHYTPKHKSSCHKSEPHKPGQAENRQRKCARISPPS